MTEFSSASHANPAPGAATRVDRRALLELAEAIGGEGLLLTVVQFEEDALATVAQLDGLIANPDEDLLRRAAHRLKGLCTQFGLPDVAALATELEHIAAEHMVPKAKDLRQAAAAGIPAVRAVCLEITRAA